MAWYRHHFCCDACDGTWLQHCADQREDDCPYCGTRDVFPYRTDDWTVIIERDGDDFVVLASGETADDDDPDYRELGTFNSFEQARAFLSNRPANAA